METTAASTANTTAGHCGATTTQYNPPATEFTARAPWVCPKCGRANAPWVDSCPCVATPPVAVPVPYPVYPSPRWSEPHYWHGPVIVACQAAT